MLAPLSQIEIGRMVVVAEEVAAGKVPPSSFFEYWPDIARGEDEDVRELWFSASYYESDTAGGAESAEFFRQAMLKYSSRLRGRFQIQTKEEPISERSAAP